MTEEEKMMKMFTAVHGRMTGSVCYTEVVSSDDADGANEAGVYLMKDGSECWHVSKADLLWDYATKGW